MTPERWVQVESVCAAALQRPPSDRARFLEGACTGDEDLREEVESLLAHLVADPEFLEAPLVDVARLIDAGAEPVVQDPVHIGGYRVVRPIGHGGMGDVFLVVHPQTEQHVALKVMRRGLDSEEVLDRFRQERRILASLDHPHIARLLDAGTTDEGLPYFAMEYVEGEPIDAHCERRALPVAERVRLVIDVCHAVQHAHGHLVVHRDIKPSNILVTPEGSPKLLDFGIGKILAPTWDGDSGDVRTRTDIRFLTPEYASPEQVKGERVTTATDIHGLGLLLYRLLTGQRAYAAVSGREALERAICVEEPGLPSERPLEAIARRALAGDLDTIVLKALRKEPERRYPSASALADDLERHLDGRPVLARPDTFRYRAAKFVRRNPWGVTAAGVSVAALAGFSVVTAITSREVARERDEALEVRGFLLESFGAVGPQGAEDPVAARELLDQQAATLEYVYGDRPELRAEMLQVLAEAYDRLGLYEQAELHARTALGVRREMAEADPVDLAAAMALLGWIRVQQSETTEADSLLRSAIVLFRDAGAPGRRGLARALNDLGVLHQQLGNLDAAEAALDEALALRTRYFDRDARALAITANNVAAVRYGRGDYEAALPSFEQALSALRRTVGPDHQRAVIAQTNVATVHLVLGDWARAEAELRDLLERNSRTQGRSHPVTTRVMTSLASTLDNLDEHAEAATLLREVLAAQEQSLGREHPQVGITLRALANALIGSGAGEEAVIAADRGWEVLRAEYGPSHLETGHALAIRSRAFRATGAIALADSLAAEALELLDSTAGPSHPLSVSERWRLASELNATGRHAEARTALERAHESAAGIDGRTGPMLLASVRLEMARAELGLGNERAADSLLALVEAGPVGRLQVSQREWVSELRRQIPTPSPRGPAGR